MDYILSGNVWTIGGKKLNFRFGKRYPQKFKHNNIIMYDTIYYSIYVQYYNYNTRMYYIILYCYIDKYTARRIVSNNVILYVYSTKHSCRLAYRRMKFITIITSYIIYYIIIRACRTRAESLRELLQTPLGGVRFR